MSEQKHIHSRVVQFVRSLSYTQKQQLLKALQKKKFGTPSKRRYNELIEADDGGRRGGRSTMRRLYELGDESKVRTALRELERRPDLKPFFHPSKVNNIPFYEHCDPMPVALSKGKEIGRGGSGTVNICFRGTCDAYVAKMQLYEKGEFEREVDMTQFMGIMGIGARVIHVYKCFLQKDHMYGVIIMQRMDGTLLDLIDKKSEITQADINQIEHLIDRMHEAGIVHRDLYPKNIGYIGHPPNRRFYIIDYGVAIATDGKSQSQLIDMFAEDIEDFHSSFRQMQQMYEPDSEPDGETDSESGDE